MKHYHDIDAAALMDEVDKQGGKWLAETCVSEEYEFTMPDGRTVHHVTNDCEEDALFLVPYDSTKRVFVDEPILMPDPSVDAPDGRRVSQKDDNGIVLCEYVEREGEKRDSKDREFVKVCANDDLMRVWPRFQHVIRRPDPTRVSG